MSAVPSPSVPTFGTTTEDIKMYPPAQDVLARFGVTDPTSIMMIGLGIMPAPEGAEEYFESLARVVPTGTGFEVTEECDCGGDCGVLATFTNGPLAGEKVVLRTGQYVTEQIVTPSDESFARILDEWSYLSDDTDEE